MSSTLRTFSQIEPTVKFLRQLPSADPSANYTYVTESNMASFITGAGASNVEGSGLNTVVKSLSAPTTSSVLETAIPNLVRDLGRRVTIVSTATGNAHRQVWIQVSGVNGVGSEGVAEDTSYPYDYGCFWIRVYRDADGGSQNIEWARLG
jgi:hypothetical protein